jgi:hypothetical protein
MDHERGCLDKFGIKYNGEKKCKQSIVDIPGVSRNSGACPSSTISHLGSRIVEYNINGETIAQYLLKL